MIRILLATGLAAVVLAPAAVAADTPPDLAGTWQSASLEDNKIGYQLIVKESGTGNNAYNGTLKFKHRNGHSTKPVKVGLAVGKESKASYRVTIVMPGGALATGKGTVSGRLSKTDGSLYFPTCSQAWPQAMKGEEDSDCLFRELPN